MRWVALWHCEFTDRRQPHQTPFTCVRLSRNLAFTAPRCASVACCGTAAYGECLCRGVWQFSFLLVLKAEDRVRS